MVKLHFLGTLSGTEPFPDMHHCSWVLEINGVNYWFDAGENCVHRAHTSGINVMNTVALFVSHPHLDHIGGMANLLSCIEKFESRYKQTLVRDNTLQVFFPDLNVLDAVKTVACGNTVHALAHNIEEHSITDGLLFKDENVSVTALHNTHLKEDGSRGWHSYSFLIETDGKKIVFSGDVGKPCELEPLIKNGCDMLIMETGHHDVEEVYNYAISHKVSHLRLTHHGRQIIEHRGKYERLAAKYTAENNICIRICYDGMTKEF